MNKSPHNYTTSITPPTFTCSVTSVGMFPQHPLPLIYSIASLQNFLYNWSGLWMKKGNSCFRGATSRVRSGMMDSGHFVSGYIFWPMPATQRRPTWGSSSNGERSCAHTGQSQRALDTKLAIDSGSHLSLQCTGFAKNLRKTYERLFERYVRKAKRLMFIKSSITTTYRNLRVFGKGVAFRCSVERPPNDPRTI